MSGIESTSPHVRWDEHPDAIGVITLDRPPVNAFNWDLKRALARLLGDIGTSAQVRCVIIASDHPKVFCAGSDLFELAADHDTDGSAEERSRFEFDLWERLSNLPQPSVAAIDGHALGSGLEMAIACDFRIAGDGASLGLPEIKIGGGPGIQTLARLTYLVGSAAARRMLLFGDSLTAAEAGELGLVDEVVAAGTAFDTAMARAQRLAHYPRSSIRYLKSALAAAIAPSVRSVEETVMAEAKALFLAGEMREGIRAFMEKRPPDFDAIPHLQTPETP